MANALHDALLAPHYRNGQPFLHLPGGSVVTFAGFIEQARKLAAALAGQGVAPGDRVAVQVEKSPEALALYAACVIAGAAFLPLNTAYTATEIAYLADDAEPALVVCDTGSETALAPIAAKCGASLLTLNADGSGSLSDLAETRSAQFNPVGRTKDDLAAILYTSGTTGRSKGAMLSHGNLVSNARTLQEYWRFSADDTLLHALPIFHTHGLFVATNVMLAAGGSMIFLPGFNTDAVIAHLPMATAMMGVPAFYTRLLDDPRLTGELVSHMRLFISGSAPLLADTHASFEARTGKRILERYGMTETNMNTSNPYEGERRAGTVGCPLPDVELRICDPDDGRKLPGGETGVIEVRGPNVFKGYWRMPEKTDAEFRADGFFITGDLGRVDEDGYIHIVGRTKDLIISRGYNIYPREVELLIDGEEGVRETAVIGVPHPDFGEAVVAVVVAETGAALEEQALLDTLKDGIARFKQPKRLFIVDQLPRNAMGKVQKNLLRETYRSLFG